MPEVRNALTKALADGLYLRLDTTNDPLTGDLEFSKVAPLVTFTDTGNAGADHDFTIGTSSNDLLITDINKDLATETNNGFIDLDHAIRTRNTAPTATTFTQKAAIYNRPTVNQTGAAVAGYYCLEDASTVTINGSYNAFGVIQARGTCTCTSTNLLEAVYLFVNVMGNTATTGNNPATIHSYESKPRVFAATGIFPAACPEIVGFNDWSNVESEGTGTITLTNWITVSAMPFDPFYYRIQTDNAAGSVTVTNRIGFRMGEVTKAVGGGTETITNYYGILFDPFTNASTLSCGIWIGKQQNATSNYGIVLDGDGIGCEARFGDGQDAAIYYDGTDLILDPDIVGTGKVLIGTTGDDDMLLTNLEAAGNVTINTDSNYLYLGTGQDVSLTYDGTDCILTTDLVAASDFVVDCGTDKTIELTETVWDDLRIPGLSVRVGATAPSFGQFLGAGGLYVYLFDGAALAEEVHFTIQLPHKYKEGTNITPHVHWSPTTAGAGNVKWFLEYSWQNIDGTFGVSTTINVVDAASGTAWDHQVGYFSGITGTGKTISSMLVCRLYRDPNDAQDTYAADAAFLEFDFHFEADTIGSRQETVK